MKPWMWGVGVLFSFGAGIALGMLLIPDDSKRPRSILPDDESALQLPDPPAIADSKPDTTVPQEATVARPADKPAPAPVFNDPPPGADPLLAALRAIGLAPTESGSGVIAGQVKTYEGEPVAGVAIQLLPPNPSQPFSLWRAPSASEEPWEKVTADTREFVRWRMSQRPPQLRALTDGNGNFRIGGLADLRYRVVAALDGYEFDYRSGQSHKPDATLEILARPVMEVKLRINLPPGVELDDCRVAHRDLGSGNWDRDLPTPEGGVWTAQLQPGIHAFTARINDPRTPGPPSILHLKPGMGPQEITLELGEISSISGFVSTGDGGATSGLYVVCVPLDSGADAETTLENARRQGTNRRSVNHEGRYTFPVMKPGDYAIAAFFGDTYFQPQKLQHGGGTSTVNFTVEGPDASECIVCTISVHDGSPLVTPRFSFRSADGMRNTSTSAWKAGENQYRVLLPRNQLPTPQDLVVTDGRNGSGSVTLHSLTPQSVSVSLEPHATLALRIAGTTHQNIYAMLSDVHGKVVYRRHLNNWVGDILSIGSVPPGVMKLELSIGSGRSALPLVSQQITVAPEGSIIDVALPELYEVTFNMPEGERTQIIIEGEQDGKAFTRQAYYNNRPTKVSSLPAGRYTAKWRPRGAREQKTQYFSLPGADTVELTN